MNEKFMARAIELAIQSVKKGTGPFGACVTRKNTIISDDEKVFSCNGYLKKNSFFF